MPQIYSKVSSTLETVSSVDNNNQMLLKDITKTKANIRERLNLHVKRRIQDQDIVPLPQITQTFTSSSSTSLLSPTGSISIQPANTTYPFNNTVHCDVLRGNSSTLLIANNSNGRTTPHLYNSNVRLMNIGSTIEQNSDLSKNLNNNNNSNKKTSTKRLNNRKKIVNNKHHTKMIDNHNNNRILSPGTSTVAVGESMDKPMQISNLESHGLDPDDDNNKYCYEKQNDSKSTNSQDILSLILATKKNALMHDPEVIKLISSLQ